MRCGIMCRATQKRTNTHANQHSRQLERKRKRQHPGADDPGNKFVHAQTGEHVTIGSCSRAWVGYVGGGEKKVSSFKSVQSHAVSSNHSGLVDACSDGSTTALQVSVNAAKQQLYLW